MQRCPQFGMDVQLVELVPDAGVIPEGVSCVLLCPGAPLLCKTVTLAASTSLLNGGCVRHRVAHGEGVWQQDGSAITRAYATFSSSCMSVISGNASTVPMCCHGAQLSCVHVGMPSLHTWPAYLSVYSLAVGLHTWPEVPGPVCIQPGLHDVTGTRANS